MEFSIFTVKTLPELTDLIIGSDENEFSSYSFYCSKECVIADLASLQTLELGASSFFTTQKLELSNLPSLISLSVAAGSLLQTDDTEPAGASESGISVDRKRLHERSASLSN